MNSPKNHNGYLYHSLQTNYIDMFLITYIYIYIYIHIYIYIQDILIQAPTFLFLDCYPGWHLNPGFMGRRPTSCWGAQDGLGHISLLQLQKNGKRICMWTCWEIASQCIFMHFSSFHLGFLVVASEERLEDPVPEPLPMSDSTAERHDTATDAPADPPPEDAKGCVENSGSWATELWLIR